MVAIKELLFCRHGDKVYARDLLEEKRGDSSTSVEAPAPAIAQPVYTGGPLEGLRRNRREQFDRRQKDLLQHLEDITSNPGEVQEQVRGDILSRNSEAEYLQRFGLQGRKDWEAFRTLPVVEYEDIEADIRRVVIDGDKAPVLSVDPPIEVLASSATSGGARKLFPAVEGDAERRALAESLVRAILHRDMPGLDQGKCLYFFFCREATQLPSGLRCHNVLSSDYRHYTFKQRAYDPSFVLTSPNEVILGTDLEQTMYCHLLLGLVQSAEVLRLGAVFAYTLLRALTYLAEVWQDLCQDIATGTVGVRITDPVLREACGEFVNKPDPDLAAKLRTACAGGIGAGIIPRLWPNAKVIDVVTTGSMEAYIPTLEMYGGGVKVVCAQLYGASECYIGLNMKPLTRPDAVFYAIIPDMAYFEFLPLAQARNGREECLKHKLVTLVDVEVGHEYELVVTTYAGLYRYRLGDILRCTGHYNKTPEFYFVGRTNLALSVAFERTTDRELQYAVTKATQHLQASGVHLIEYTSYCDMSSTPGRYVIFWEVSEHDPQLAPEVLEQCCSTMENNISEPYCIFREGGDLGPLELRVVQGGTFTKLESMAISQGSSFALNKFPRCLKQPAMVDLANSCVRQAHSSSRMPRWKGSGTRDSLDT